MKTKEITTSKATILVVDLPVESINPVASMGYLIFREPNYSNWVTDDILMNPIKLVEYEEKHDSSKDYKDATPVKIPDGNWQHLGQLSDIIEEQWKDIVDDPFIKGLSQYEKPSDLEGWKYVNSPMGVRYEKDTHISFKDYNTLSDGLSIANQHLFGTAKESGISLLKANGVLLENTFDSEPQLSDYVFEDHPELVGNPKEYDLDTFNIDSYKWQQAQEQVWLNTHVFIKK